MNFVLGGRTNRQLRNCVELTVLRARCAATGFRCVCRTARTPPNAVASEHKHEAFRGTCGIALALVVSAALALRSGKGKLVLWRAAGTAGGVGIAAAVQQLRMSVLAPALRQRWAGGETPRGPASTQRPEAEVRAGCK